MVDKNLRHNATQFFLVNLILSCFVIIPLCWTIPMYQLYKKAEKDNIEHVALGVCSILFCGVFGLVAGIMMLVSNNQK